VNTLLTRKKGKGEEGEETVQHVSKNSLIISVD